MEQQEKVEMLVWAVCQRSPMHADKVGLPLKAEELEYIYERIGKHFLEERIKKYYQLVPHAPLMEMERWEKDR